MKTNIRVFIFTFLMVTLGYVRTGNTGMPTNVDVPIKIVRSCEMQDDNACITKKFEQALGLNSMSTDDKLIIRYELAARYEFYDKDLIKAREMYLEIEKIDPNYGITLRCLKRLSSLISGFANR